MLLWVQYMDINHNDPSYCGIHESSLNKFFEETNYISQGTKIRVVLINQIYIYNSKERDMDINQPRLRHFFRHNQL